MRNILLISQICGQWLEIQLSVRLKGTMAIGRFNLMPRPGLEPTVRFDICENAAFTNFAINAIYAMRNNILTKIQLEVVGDDRG